MTAYKPQKNHRKNGSFRAGNQARSLPAGSARVVLPAQRIAPSTMEIIEARAESVGGVGRLIDAAMLAWVDLERRMGVAPPK